MKRTENIFQNEHYWKEFNEKELNLYADKILSYYRKSGFPFYKTDNSYRSNEFLKLFKYDCSTIIINKLVKQTMHGLALQCIANAKSIEH